MIKKLQNLLFSKLLSVKKDKDEDAFFREQIFGNENLRAQVSHVDDAMQASIISRRQRKVINRIEMAKKNKHLFREKYGNQVDQEGFGGVQMSYVMFYQ